MHLHFVSSVNPTALAPWLQVLQGLLTPVIGLTTLYIAWQQWKGNQLKLVLDRYERRLRIYQEVVGILILVQRDFKPEFSDFQKFRSATAEADFLFPPEIAIYLDEIVKRGMKLRQANLEYRDLTQTPPPGYDHNKVVTEMHEQEVWFTEQFELAKQKFKRYLYVS
jgi:hypothetical protein